jgi:hypothetical protein
MKEVKTIECHDCGAEIKIHDPYDDQPVTSLKFCPVCGSENVLSYNSDNESAGE